MSRFLLSLVCIVSFFTTIGQRNYQQAIDSGNYYFDKGDFKTAINKYFAAEAFDPSKKEMVKAKVNKAFDAIEALRKKAEVDKKHAVKAEKEAKIQTQKSQSLTLAAFASEQLDKNPTLAIRLAASYPRYGFAQ